MSKKKPWVVKVGSACLTDAKGQLKLEVFQNLVSDIAKIIKAGQPVCLVSSGAVGAGMLSLQRQKRPKKLKKIQALAAVGQVRLMQIYHDLFEKEGLMIGQVLLSHDDFSHRETFLNTRSTLTQLLELGVIPIVNENDSVSTEEIEFGDNDRLAVLIANAVEADFCTILSTAPGLLDLEGSGEAIPVIKKIDERIFSMAKGGNQMGRGGMGSKLISIDVLNKSGKTAVLADGRVKGVLMEIFEGKQVGTRFLATSSRKSSREQWMLQHLKPHGVLNLDEGAFKAVTQKKASLLSVGVKSCRGNWKTGQLVSLKYENREFARGMIRMSHADLSKILGKKRENVERILGEQVPSYLIHRNDISILDAN
jgi:glutamate 5-kinase